MEQLLPLLIGGIIWLAFKYYGKSQNKQTTTNQSGSSENKSTTREPSILEQILLGPRINDPEPELYYEEVEEEHVPENDIKKALEQRFSKAFLSTELSQLKREGQHAVLTKSIDNEEELMVLEQDRSGWIFDEEFDMKKAIIYEAVLNPPYIDFK
ncbi:MAG TPA: hypothetical protein PK904_11230 [Bacteroidales bacterium]|nr:hypothetical protein [Bacteroidales bacterium]HPE56965.1 hypothetical protein [Bacteroidales bacterium]